MLQALSAVVMGATLPLKLAAEKLVWGKIRDGVGGRVKVVVSGGSSLPSFLEDFFEMAGVRCARASCLCLSCCLISIDDLFSLCAYYVVTATLAYPMPCFSLPSYLRVPLPMVWYGLPVEDLFRLGISATVIAV